MRSLDKPARSQEGSGTFSPSPTHEPHVPKKGSLLVPYGMPRPSPGLQVETLKQSPISDPAVAYRDFIRSQSMEFTREPSAIHHLVSLAYNVAPHQYLRLFPGLPHRTKRGIRSKGRQLSDGSLD